MTDESPSVHSWQYDAFISYTHFDDQLNNLVKALAERLSVRFKEATGTRLRIFLDVRDVSNAMLWEERILGALSSSATLIPVETPSYLTSEWCQKELDTFLVLERERRHVYGLLPYESLIFPVLRIPPEAPHRGSAEAHSRQQELSSRQATNLTHIEPGTEQFNTAVDRLVDDLIPILQKLSYAGFPSIASEGPARKMRRVTVPLVSTSSRFDPTAQLQLLSDAEAVTVVGIANEWLADILEEAIEQKRVKANDSGAFWDHLHIVFLADGQLINVEDELSTEFPDPNDAWQERARRAAQSRRRIMSLLLRLGIPGRWTIFSYPYALPFSGSLFAMRDGKRIVQLNVRHPSRSEPDQLHIDFFDRIDEFFESAFHTIVESSKEEHEVVLVGTPGREKHTFLCQKPRYRRSVLVEGRNFSDWIPAIVAITWREGRTGPEPLLQVNTPRNSTREMGKASHVSGYINLRDHVFPEALAASERTPFTVGVEAAERALARELLQDFGIRSCPSLPVLIGTEPFYYSDKENLFFYLFSQQIDSTHVFAPSTQMFPWTITELVNTRRRQVLVNAGDLLTQDLNNQQRRRAQELVAANLEAHGDRDLANEVVRALQTQNASSELISRLRAAASDIQVYKYAAAHELAASGLAGLQYRIFFSHLLPAYASLGMPGAEELLEDIRSAPAVFNAAEHLTALYSNEDFMMSLPMEI